MKKVPSPDNDEMLEEYDFGNGAKGKYAEMYSAGTNVVLLDPDVAEVFRDSSSVNDALRTLIKVSRQVVTQSYDK
ncbi:MAG TPA: hypothetical protein VGE45_20250 [Chloroflexia bacterium]|jgi:hypothetical protein